MCKVKNREAVRREGSIVQIFKTIREAKYPQGENSRLCRNLTQLYKHLNLSETGDKHGNACKICGKVVYSKCFICGVYLHFMANIVQSEIKYWIYPSVAKKISNTRIINRLNNDLS